MRFFLLNKYVLLEIPSNRLAKEQGTALFLEVKEKKIINYDDRYLEVAEQVKLVTL